MKQDPPSDPENQIYCVKCNKILPSLDALDRHSQSCFVGKRFNCPRCGCDKSFSQNLIMLQHVKGVHDNDPFKCKKCDSTFVFKKVLDHHVKRSHSTNVNFKYYCDKCAKGFDNKTQNSY